MELPKWTAAFCSLFVINMFASGTMKVCGIFFQSMETVDGVSALLAGLIFVAPSAVSHCVAPIVSAFSSRCLHRHLGLVGGVLVGTSFIGSGLFATHGLHFLLFSITAGVGFGFLFLPAVLCLKETASGQFASLMPLATTGSYVGIIVLPGIVEVFLKNYGLHATFCMFGALAYNTIPCGLVLSDVRSGKQSTEGSGVQSRSETIPFKLRRIESNIQLRAEEGSSSLEAVMAVKSEITYPSNSQSETNNVQDKLNTDWESNTSNSGVQSRSETIPSKQRGIESNIQSRAEEGSSSLEAVIAVKSEITYPSNSQSETNNVQDKLNTDRESNNSKIQTTTNPFAAERIIQTVKSIKSFIQTFLVQFKLFGDVVFTLYFITVNMRKFPSNSWTLFLIPLSQELGVTKQTAVIISAIGGVGGIMGRFLAAVSFKVSKTISPLTLFATYYLCDAFIFALFPTTTNVILLGICAFFSGLLLSAKAGMTSGILLHLTTAETFRQAFGLVDCGCGVYSLLTGFISGASYDVYGSFKNLFRISALVCAISCVFVICIIFLQKLKKKKHADSENGEDSD
ncbi:uncharacterized protein [Apostichopus japonicus]|uniref:uncharacterized protein isoform X1 n=1 Tax=Stichopus japonicus TaxID=307972 RepID=UPI003AB79A62